MQSRHLRVLVMTWELDQKYNIFCSHFLGLGLFRGLNPAYNCIFGEEHFVRTILCEGDFLSQKLKECLRELEKMRGMEHDILVGIIEGRKRRIKDSSV